jgi:pimeloyl-ACP methyl ester carboxylesterase
VLTAGTIDLTERRRLDYCEWGARDAPAVAYFHGTPGTRRELLLARATLERLSIHVRVIAINRPGYGSSTFRVPGGFLPVAEDIAEAMHRLGVFEFAVLGASGGSPFALACALAQPDRVTRVAIVAGVAPPRTAGMETAAAIADEATSGVVRSLRYGTMSLGVRLGLTAHLARRLVGSLGLADRRALQHPDERRALEAILQEALSQWGRASAAEAGLFLHEWDFEPALITQPIRLWHGGDDNRIPAGVAVAFADRLPNAAATVWPQHGHFSWATSDELADVVGFLTAS